MTEVDRRNVAHMGTKAAGERHGQLTPSAAVAVAAGAAGAVLSCCVFLLWRFQPALAVPLLILSPLPVAAAAWLVARRAIAKALRPAVTALERFSQQDFTADADLGPAGETAELARALARCRTELATRHATTRAHAAVARLMGAGIGRLAQADYAARIDAALPAPYDAFAGDFNAAMERLAATAAESDALRAGIGERADALDEAARRLGRRAEKLASRIEADLRIIAALSRRDAQDALEIARHTMEGVGVAARRNVEAAEAFAELARTLRDAAGPPAMAASPARASLASSPASGKDMAA